MRAFVHCAKAILLLVVCVSSVAAQAPAPISLEASLGLGEGSTAGFYHNETGAITVDLLVAARVRSLQDGGLVVAVGAGIQGSGNTELACMLDAPCEATFPEFSIFSASVGWESPGGGVRGLVGPAAAHAEDTALAWMARIDLGKRVIGRLWLLASARGFLVPDYRGDEFRLGSLGVGVRIR